jgi:hypothetical protein
MGLSRHQLAMLKKASSWDGGMVSIRWYTMRTARALERRGFGRVTDYFNWAGWGIAGWCFVVNDDGRRMAEQYDA